MRFEKSVRSAAGSTSFTTRMPDTCVIVNGHHIQKATINREFWPFTRLVGYFIDGVAFPSTAIWLAPVPDLRLSIL